MSDLKAPVKIAQEQLGHASVSTTLNIYTHTIAAYTATPWQRSRDVCSRMFSNCPLARTARSPQVTVRTKL